MHVCTGKTPSPALLSCFMHLLLLFFLSVLVLHFDPPWNLMGALLFITALVHHLAGSFILTDSFVYSSKTERLSDIAWSKLAENIYYRFGSNTPCSIFTLVSCWLPTNSFWPDTAKRGTTLQSDGNHSVHYVFAANVFICNHYTQTLQCAVSCCKQSADLNYKYKRMELYCPYYSLSTHSTKFQYKYKRR